jgi:hypothetical protein
MQAKVVESIYVRPDISCKMPGRVIMTSGKLILYPVRLSAPECIIWHPVKIKTMIVKKIARHLFIPVKLRIQQIKIQWQLKVRNTIP